jgi:hypothetical protein
MRSIVSLIALAALAVLASACAPEVPEQPTWTEDVRPIILANCVRCHSPPQLGGAPSFVRFDKYDNEDRDGDGNPDVFGAGSTATAIATRVEAEEMPPRFPLWPRQRDVIVAWAESGALEGPPVEGNQPPTMELFGFEPIGGVLTGGYVIEDPDFDLVTGTVTADPDGNGNPFAITFDLFSGVGKIEWDVSGVVAGSYELSAVIDDGNGAEVTVDLGSVEVAP